MGKGYLAVNNYLLAKQFYLWSLVSQETLELKGELRQSQNSFHRSGSTLFVYLMKLLLLKLSMPLTMLIVLL